MKINLIKGTFTPKEIEIILTQMLYVKIKFHENKITRESSEEDIKMRESRIIQLQKDLYELNVHFKKITQSVTVDVKVEL